MDVSFPCETEFIKNVDVSIFLLREMCIYTLMTNTSSPISLKFNTATGMSIQNESTTNQKDHLQIRAPLNSNFSLLVKSS